MKSVAVITGGAGGMGLATAKILGRDHHVLISDINEQRLNSALAQLRQSGVSCDAFACNVCDRQSVDALASRSQSLGPVAAVIHTAGISPQMGGPEIILRVNALGTINITEAFYPLASEGFALVNVASMAGHLLPAAIIPAWAYRYADADPEKFIRKVAFRCRLMPSALYRSGMAYGISKHFVMWYSQRNAARFGEKQARVLSVSPGTFDTEMGRVEEKSGSMEMLKRAALKRPGRPEEIAEVLAFCASARASYMTGVDILCDGGVVAARGK